MTTRAYYAARGWANKELLVRNEAIHRALSFLQRIVDDEPYTTGEADRVMEQLAAWATPAAREAGGTPEQFLARKRRLKGACGVSLASLSLQASLASWATPTVRDHKDGASKGTAPTNCLLGRQAWLTSTASTGKCGQLNPEHSRWLMGYPKEWGSCGVTAMQSFRNSRRRSSKQ